MAYEIVIENSRGDEMIREDFDENELMDANEIISQWWGQEMEEISWHDTACGDYDYCVKFVETEIDDNDEKIEIVLSQTGFNLIPNGDE